MILICLLKFHLCTCERMFLTLCVLFYRPTPSGKMERPMSKPTSNTTPMPSTNKELTDNTKDKPMASTTMASTTITANKTLPTTKWPRTVRTVSWNRITRATTTPIKERTENNTRECTNSVLCTSSFAPRTAAARAHTVLTTSLSSTNSLMP